MQLDLPTEPIVIGILIAVVLVAGLLGFLFAYLRAGKQIARLREHSAQLEANLEMERRSAREKLEALNDARNQLTDTFNALSAQALKNNNDEFLKLARENLKQFQVKAQGDL